MTEIAQGVAAAFRCTAEVSFADYCPCMVVDKLLAENAMDYMTELLGKGAMDMTALTGGKPGGGSEDFAFVSHEVPTVSMFIAAGRPGAGLLLRPAPPQGAVRRQHPLRGLCGLWLVRTPLAVRQRRHRVLILRQQKALSAPLRGPFYRYQVWVQR